MSPHLFMQPNTNSTSTVAVVVLRETMGLDRELSFHKVIPSIENLLHIQVKFICCVVLGEIGAG
jgi:hypothetical protein